MAREIHEIKSFNVGTVSNADNKDIPEESAVFSYGIDGNSSGGVLVGEQSDRFVGGNSDNNVSSSMTYDSNLTLDGSLGGGVDDTTVTLQHNEAWMLSPGWHIRIDTEVMRVISIIGNATILVDRAQSGTTVASHADSSKIYININPNVVIPMSKDGILEDLIVFDSSKSRIDVIRDFIHSTNEIIGTSINLDEGFPHRGLWVGDVDFNRDKKSVTVSFGKGYGPKWIGYISGSRINRLSEGYYMDVAQCRRPILDSPANFYENPKNKRVLFQGHTTAAGAGYTDMTQVDNTTNALIVQKGQNFIDVVNPDDNTQYQSEELYFKGHRYHAQSIAKCVSCKTHIKVWVYATIVLADFTPGAEQTSDYIGKVFLIKIADLSGGSASVEIGADGHYDTANGFPLIVEKIVNFRHAIDHTKGYPSQSFWGHGNVAGLENSEGGAEISGSHVHAKEPPFTASPIWNIKIGDILETVDNTGNGKLWFLFCPAYENLEPELFYWPTHFTNVWDHSQSWFRAGVRTEDYTTWDECTGQFSDTGGYYNISTDVFSHNYSFRGTNDWTAFNSASISTDSTNGKLNVDCGGVANRGAQLLTASIPTASSQRAVVQNFWNHNRPGTNVFKRQYVKLSCASGTIAGFKVSNCDNGSSSGANITTDLIPLDGGTTGTVSDVPRWFYFEINNGDSTNFSSDKLQILTTTPTSTVWYIDEMGPGKAFYTDTKKIYPKKKHRFLFCSFENVDGDWTGGTETTIHLNCKSWPLNSMQRYSNQNLYHGEVGDFWGYGHKELSIVSTKYNEPANMVTDVFDDTTYGKDFIKMTMMQRSVPNSSCAEYTEPKAVPFSADTGATASNDHRMHLLVSGGSWWYRDCRDGRYADGSDPVESWDCMHKSSIHDESRDDGEITGTPLFAPIPNSLVDLSDVYGVTHTVGCNIEIDPEHDAKILDDMFINERSRGASFYTGIGARTINLKGRMVQWISSGGLENYGADYVRQNGFGYKLGATTDYSTYDKVNLSTMVYDKSNKLVRMIKILPETDNMTSRDARHIERNCIFPNVAWSGNTTHTDSNSKYHALISLSSGESSRTDNQTDTPFPNQVGVFIRNNTTAERGTTSTDLITGSATDISGFCNNNTTDADYIIRNDSLADSKYKSPKNELVCGNVLDATPGNASGVVSIGALGVNAAISGTSSTPADIVMNGPGYLAFFGGDGTSGSNYEAHTFNKLKYNGFNTGTGQILSPMEIKDTDGQTWSSEPASGSTPVIFPFTGIYEMESGLNGCAELDSGDNDAAGADINFGWTRAWPIEHNAASVHDISEVSSLKEAAEPYIRLKANPMLAIGQGGPSKSATGINSRWGANGYKFSAQVLTADSTTEHSPTLNFTLANNGSTEDQIDDNDYNFTGITDTYIYAQDLFAAANDKVSVIFSHPGTQEDLVCSDEVGPGDQAEWEEWEEQGVQDQEGYPFPIGVKRWYKLVYEYDGTQYSPLSNSTAIFENNDPMNCHWKAVTVDVSILRSTISKRVTGIHLFRQNMADGDWLHVKKWSTTNGVDIQTTNDIVNDPSANGDVYATMKHVDKFFGAIDDYEKVTGMSPTVQELLPSYECSTSYGGYLFVGDLKWKFLTEDFSQFIWRSKYRAYNNFDPTSTTDFVKISASPVSLKSFSNRIYAFTKTALIKIEPSNFVQEHVYEGFGILNKYSVVVTDYGIFWADKYHIYHMDGSSPKVISFPVERDLFSGVNKGWRDLADETHTKASYDLKSQCVMFSKTVDGKTYSLKYNLLKSRWDLNVPTDFADTEYVLPGSRFKSELNSSFYYTKSANSSGAPTMLELAGNSSTTKKFQWWSKEFTMGHDNVDKRFIKLKVTASGTLTQPTIVIDGVSQSITSVGATSGEGVYEYKINKKGKKIQIRWGDGTNSSSQMANENISISSIGIVYRRTKVK